jgi:glycosyltransferase involved in cell wall biosynthesis
MAALDDIGGADEAAGRQFVRQFDNDRQRAVSQFAELSPQKAQAGKLLQSLNKLNRHDIVLAATDPLSFDSRTVDLIITERARALVLTGAASLAEEFLDKMSAIRRNDYAFLYGAGRVLDEAKLLRQALVYYEAAFRAKPTAIAADRIFFTHLALGQYDEAAAAVGRIIRTGNYREALAADFAFLLRHIAPGKLDPDLAFALASLPGKDEAEVAPALLPHLVASDLLSSVLAAVDRGIGNFANWDDEVLLSVIPYLERRGQIDHLLRVYEQSDGISAPVKAHFERLFGGMPTSQMTKFVAPDTTGFLDDSSSNGRAYREFEAAFSQTADAETALQMLQLLPSIVEGDRIEPFYAREKRKLGRLAGLVAEKLGNRASAMDMLVAFVAHWARPAFGPFFAGHGAAELSEAIVAAHKITSASDNSKLAAFREEYFRFYLERRSFVEIDSLTNDFDFCRAAFDYFSFASHQRPAVSTPVGAALATRSGRTALSFGGDKPLDMLTSFAMMQDRSKIPPAQISDFDEFCWWYLSKFVAPRRIPPACFRPEIVAHLNVSLVADTFSGVPITRFLKLIWSKSIVYRQAYDIGNFVDRIHFILKLISEFLPQATQYLPLFGPFLVDGDNAFLPRIVASLTSDATVVDAARGRIPVHARVSERAAPQDVILIGHASKDTGLGRNFRMLSEALISDATVVTGIDFDAHPDTFNEQLGQAYARRRTQPLVVFAVNAHDVPDAFLRDWRNLLSDCYCAGFFLWEVSRVPQVQELGVRLVDEVWAPTTYVADIYAPLVPVHVVGKGLYRGDEEFFTRPRAPSKKSAFTFVTAFDFDSSIERKNPLATVLAFQEAFHADERVELIVKTSNVNPQHWSNTTRHWENLIEAALGDKRIKIVTQRYSNDEMTALVCDADCVVSLHRSEGFGYLAVDAMAFGTPVIATDYSGNADFCTADTSYPVPYRLIAVPPGAARWRCDDALWADADIAAAAKQMQAVFGDPVAAREKAARARQNIRSKFAIERFHATIAARIEAIRERQHAA